MCESPIQHITLCLRHSGSLGTLPGEPRAPTEPGGDKQAKNYAVFDECCDGHT